ncbi:MAG: HIT family protein [Gallionellaceae bacterium]
MSSENTQCPFCEIPPHSLILENGFAFAIRDRFPVTHLHTLVIPKRHVIDYFWLDQNEREACNQLMQDLRIRILEEDPNVGGFNIGVNAGEVAGQTIFHCHIHLIPRRRGDVRDPRGGVRHLIKGKGYY